MRWFNSLGEMKVPETALPPFIYTPHVLTHTHTLFADYLGKAKLYIPASPAPGLVNWECINEQSTLRHPRVLGFLFGEQFHEKASLEHSSLQQEHADNYTSLWQNTWQVFSASMKLTLTEVISHQLFKFIFSFWSNKTDLFIFKWGWWVMVI